MLPSNFKQSPSEPLSIKKVWVLNAIPFLGAGYLYATKEKGLRLMLFVWALEAVYFSPWTIIWVYFILSVLGTAHIIKNERLRKQSANGKYRIKNNGASSGPGQVPLAVGTGGTDDLSISKRKSRAMKKAARKAAALKSEAEDKSERATDLFEHKLAAAEKMIRARAAVVDAPDLSSESNFSPSDAPKFSDEEEQKSVEEIFGAPSAVPAGGARYVSDASNNSSTNDDVAKVNLDNVFDNPYGSGLPAMDLSADTPLAVPSVDSMIASSATAVPNVDTLLVGSTTAVPNVDSVLVGSATATPALDNGSLGSVGSFEAPKFSFSFDDHQSPTAGAPAPSTGGGDNCPKCNAVKDKNFSFCLTCGQNF